MLPENIIITAELVRQMKEAGDKVYRAFEILEIAYPLARGSDVDIELMKHLDQAKDKTENAYDAIRAVLEEYLKVNSLSLPNDE